MPTSVCGGSWSTNYIWVGWWLCGQHIPESGPNANLFGGQAHHVPHVLISFGVAGSSPLIIFRFTYKPLTMLPRPNGSYLSTSKGRFLVGKEIMLLMGVPLHQYDTSFLSNRETWPTLYNVSFVLPLWKSLWWTVELRNNMLLQEMPWLCGQWCPLYVQRLLQLPQRSSSSCSMGSCNSLWADVATWKSVQLDFQHVP